ncbi:MAG: DMT family transporter [Candidatus Thermoplasmatota archaeon]|nr:DMT family transporter [Candidatus Thermoplasmatota archaeon]MCL5731053.1 DMT family transporter [Candidatus Thermoplasmatota archaeon]
MTFFWGVTFPLIKQSMEYTTPVIFLAVRFGISAAVVLPLAIKGKEIAMTRSVVPGIVSGTLLFLGYFFQTLGLVYTSAIDSGIITGLYVVLIPVLSALVFRATVMKRDYVLSLLSLSGLIIMSIFALGDLSLQIGNVLTVVCAFAYALQIIFVSRKSSGTELWSFTFYTLLTVSVLSLVSVPLYPHEFLVVNSYLLFSILFTATLAGSFAIYVQNMALRFVDAGLAGIIFVGEPIFSTAAAVFIGNESLTLFTAIGGSVMVLSMVISTYMRYREGSLS